VEGLGLPGPGRQVSSDVDNSAPLHLAARHKDYKYIVVRICRPQSTFIVLPARSVVTRHTHHFKIYISTFIPAIIYKETIPEDSE
jgi:hypothetical protein